MTSYSPALHNPIGRIWSGFTPVLRKTTSGSGSYSISSVSMPFVSLQAIINKLWFGYDLERAISSPIMHTNKDSIVFEEHFSQVSSLSWIFPSSPFDGKEIASVTLLHFASS